jgi:hypothetical protein
MEQQEAASIMFFTEADLDPKGRIKHQYPVYFNRKQKDDIQEEIRRLKTGIDKKLFPDGVMGEAREKLRKAEDALERMETMRPDFEKHKDRIAKLRDELGTGISDSLFTRDEMKKGLADAHEEARRMSEPVITLSPSAAGVAVQNGIRITGDRKVSRTDATRLWQMSREALGEMRDVEVLRRDKAKRA